MSSKDPYGAPQQPQQQQVPYGQGPSYGQAPGYGQTPAFGQAPVATQPYPAPLANTREPWHPIPAAQCWVDTE